MEFKDKVTIITGASSGIGWALARQLAEQGARVGVLARRQEKLEELAKEISALGGTVEIAPADVSERSEVAAAIQSLRQRLGPIDLVIASAGVSWKTNLDQSNIDEVEKLFKINIFGVVYAIEAVLPEMMQRRQGHIAAVSSLAAYRSFPGKAAYCASKAAVNVYLESLRIQLSLYDIAVTTICPGFVDTPMTENADFRKPWLMSAEDAARRIIRGLKKKTKVLNFPWQTTLLIKLSRWLPDWFMARQQFSYTNALPETKTPAPAESSS